MRAAPEPVLVDLSEPAAVDLVEVGRAAGLFGPAVGLVLQVASGEIVSATAEAQAILGLSLDQMTGRTSQDPRWAAVDEQGEPMGGASHPAMRALATGVPVTNVVMGVHRPGVDAAGSHLWLTVTSTPAVDASTGTVAGVVTAFTVLLGDRAQDLRVAESERMFRFLTESSVDVVAWQLPDTTFLWVSPASLHLLGRTPESLVGARAYDLMHPADAEAGRAAERAVAAGTPAPARMTVRLRHADGHWVWTEVTGRVLPGPDGRPAQLRTAWRDVTDRVRAELERDAALRLVRSSVDNSTTGIAVTGLDGVVLQANPALCAMLARTADELSGVDLRSFADPRDLPNGDDLDGTAALLDGLPVHISEGRYLRGDGGLMWGHRTAVLLRDERGAPLHVLVELDDVTERKNAVAQLARAALTDPLTGLVNRTVFMDRLTRSLAEQHSDATRVGVLFVDLDHFKPVNDTFGHDVGDEVLRQAADRITGAVREDDVVARLGGDEFVALCADIAHDATLRDVAARVVGALATPFTVGAQEVTVSASVGVTLADRSHLARDVLARADAAMYRAKQAGRGQYAVITEALETLAHDELVLDDDLCRGITAGELRLHYQPIVTAPGGEVVAREALVRWQHPTRGLLTPAAFLAAADRGPLTTTLGTWVLDRACRDATAWGDDAVVHVNVSARHLAQDGFADTVAATLSSTGLPAHRVCLEVTESLVLSASRSTLRSVGGLTEMGVGIALDDFGTGYSSISALHRIPVTALKIDIAFVQDLATPTTASLVDGLIHLGTGMGLEVIAEGIETAEQARWLTDHGCTHHQGYLYGQPVPADAPGPSTRSGG